MIRGVQYGNITAGGINHPIFIEKKRSCKFSLDVFFLVYTIFLTKDAVIYIREKEEDEALEQARQNKEQEHAKQMEKMKRERMREAERRKREAVSENINNFFL